MSCNSDDQRVIRDQETDCCDVTIIHDETVEKIRQVQMNEDQVTELASIFQALGDPTRVRIIHALIKAEICVCDLAAVLEMTQSAVSHQLRYLKNLRIVKRRKVGRTVYYSIDDEHILTLFETGLEHVSHR
ncbi:ArsR/SmtB family transcription factor [Effusibacillus consociatus]|uniref:ArsR/SmtB family transcription factor n=1 Tax=Effusibacillus consociatus TaxID=1117041 RepID=A0ABV9Q7Q5_9BACL